MRETARAWGANGFLIRYHRPARVMGASETPCRALEPHAHSCFSQWNDFVGRSAFPVGHLCCSGGLVSPIDAFAVLCEASSGGWVVISDEYKESLPIPPANEFCWNFESDRLDLFTTGGAPPNS